MNKKRYLQIAAAVAEQIKYSNVALLFFFSFENKGIDVKHMCVLHTDISSQIYSNNCR
jgi:hypothetical protein